VLIEPDTAKRDQLIKQAFESLPRISHTIPLHQQALAWGVSRGLKLTSARTRGAALLATKQE